MLGFPPKAIQAELKECMMQVRALSPAEQDEVAAALVEELKPLSDDQRAALLEQVDSGFFPPRVAKGVKAALTPRWACVL